MIQTGIHHVRMMSDSCAGQQKNATSASICLHVVKNNQTVDHAFFEPGYIEMEYGWVQIMRTARTNPRPYEVTILLYDDFQDFNSTKEYLRPCNSSSVKVRAKFCDTVWLKFRKEEPDTVFIKTDYTADTFQETTYVRKMGHPRLQSVHPYSGRFNVSATKKNLMKLCKYLLIPRYYHSFYANLPSSSDVCDVLLVPDASEDSESDE
ncbi:hypothetical protein PR048_013453 [Dryococelus australis]|uniref:Uncharacterized protein n=1 Tax=Dryococelus australis TaxID=614101 RepID=A0ABQ9HS75_9NEOP|nr:hypothetical protein PR048_013453 [Dryococelus australis]